MTKQTDFTNIANKLRDTMGAYANDEAALKAEYDFYNENQGDSYWTGLAGGDLVGDSGITKDEFLACMTFYQNYLDFLDNVAVAAADRRATIQHARTTL